MLPVRSASQDSRVTGHRSPVTLPKIPRPDPRGYPGNLGLLFAEHARSERPAIVDLRDPRRPRPVSFRELDAGCDAVARGLARAGLGPGERIGILSLVSGGENIFPGEVEALLMRHPAVHQALVLPFDHELKGQVPYAFVVLGAGASATEDELKRHALANGPAYQHPRRVFFVDRFPLSGTNKVDRDALRRLVGTAGGRALR